MRWTPLFILIIFPLAELSLLIYIGGKIGIITTLMLIFATAFSGLALLKRQGFTAWQQVKHQLASGKVPIKESLDGLLIMFCGALLLAPGFITDCVSITMLLSKKLRTLLINLILSRFVLVNHFSSFSTHSDSQSDFSDSFHAQQHRHQLGKGDNKIIDVEYQIFDKY